MQKIEDRAYELHDERINREKVVEKIIKIDEKLEALIFENSPSIKSLKSTIEKIVANNKNWIDKLTPFEKTAEELSKIESKIVAYCVPLSNRNDDAQETSTGSNNTAHNKINQVMRIKFNLQNVT